MEAYRERRRVQEHSNSPCRLSYGHVLNNAYPLGEFSGITVIFIHYINYKLQNLINVNKYIYIYIDGAGLSYDVELFCFVSLVCQL